MMFTLTSKLELVNEHQDMHTVYANFDLLVLLYHISMYIDCCEVNCYFNF